MLLQEFANLTGFTPSVNYFNHVIHPAYMASDLDKEAWCKQWKRNGGVQAAYDAMTAEADKANEQLAKYQDAYISRCEQCYMLMDEAKDLRQYKRELEEQVARLGEERMELVEFLILQAEKWSATDLRDQAIAMIGAKAYLAYKIEHKLNLWASDRELLLATLNEK